MAGYSASKQETLVFQLTPLTSQQRSLCTQNKTKLVDRSQPTGAVWLSEYSNRAFGTCVNDLTVAENQVQPFCLSTPDGEKLNAWHILPLAVYAKNEDVLLDEATGLSPDITQTQAFKLLSTDRQSRLVINCPLYVS